MVRNKDNLHIITSRGYFYSSNGGQSWASANEIGGYNNFISFTQEVLHIIYWNQGIYYIRNRTGNKTSFNPRMKQVKKEQIKIRVFPNPTNKELTFELNDYNNFENAELKIINSLGLEYFNENFGMNNKLKIEAGILKSGIYFYSLIIKDKIICNGKLIIE